ncbi:hypothetical protein [Clostridium folliculivorans]|uniref:Uncharacterized protein n=1 Tax=Clostridium folliculivorans TaxID=2886038 RepID=A0A9W5Y1F1_9CLOT|nr:hypothetical protein [Clostridium folliculivorans]GKU24818.1 hypothetical protein CFOLD11_16440 [Clostridium folliculivorans]GKU30916.1 hypothetical protein CFB3_30230 [Clostridium folliculivorans]
MDKLASIIILAGIAEAIWETIKMVFDHGKLDFNKLGAILVGVLLCLVTGADILSLIGFSPKINYVGQVLTGLLISRGANFAHDLLTSIYNLQQNTRTDNSKVETKL